jgi:hypothetical protein
MQIRTTSRICLASLLALLSACDLRVGPPSFVWSFESEAIGGLPRDWHAVDGEAQVATARQQHGETGKVLRLRATKVDASAAVLFGFEPTAPNVSTHLFMSKGGADAWGGVIVGVTNSGDGYSIAYSWSKHELELSDVHDKARTTLASAPVASSGEWIALRVKTVGNRMQCFVDDKLCLELDVTRTPSGEVGLSCSPGSCVWFDETEVSLDPNPKLEAQPSRAADPHPRSSH